MVQQTRDLNGELLQDLQLKPEDIRLIKHCREQKWGELTVKIKEGYPVMIIKIRENIRLDEE